MDTIQKALADPTFAARYELEDKLGEGGMGAVWRARHRELSRPVAIKFMAPDLAHEPGYLDRFRAEARLAASLVHPNVVVVFDCGVAGEVPYLVTELIPGRTLSDRLKEGAPGVDEALAIARDVLAGLEAIHKLGIVHRDIKPANILVRVGEPAKILDFGIAKQTGGAPLLGDDAPKTATGMVMGTPEYMAPEQAAGDPLSPATDLYAFALILFRMTVGYHPFRANTTLELLRMQLHQEPAIPDVLVPAFRDLLARGLAKKPDASIGSARAFREELDRAAAGLGGTFFVGGGATGAGPHAANAPEPTAAATQATPANARASGAAPGERQADIRTLPKLAVDGGGAVPPVAPHTGGLPIAIGAGALLLVAVAVAVRPAPVAPASALVPSASPSASPSGLPPSAGNEWNRDWTVFPNFTLSEPGLPSWPLKARAVRREADRLTSYDKGNVGLVNARALDGDRMQADVHLPTWNDYVARSSFSVLKETPEDSGRLRTKASSDEPLFVFPHKTSTGSEGAVEVAWSDARPKGTVELDLMAVRSARDGGAVVYRLRVHLDRPGFTVLVSDPARSSSAPTNRGEEWREFSWQDDAWRLVSRHELPEKSVRPDATARLALAGDELVVTIGATARRLKLPAPYVGEPAFVYPRAQFCDFTDLSLDRMTLIGDLRRAW